MLTVSRLLLLSASLLCAAAHAAPLTLAQPFFELIERDIAQPFELTDIDVAVLTTKDQCDPKFRKKFFQMVPESNERLLQSWLCTAFQAAAADASLPLAFHPIELDAYPAEPAPMAATVAGLAARAGARRYVALVDWRISHLLTPVNCGFFCSFQMNVPMEIALYDRQTGKTVWHAHHLNQDSYSGDKYEAKSAFYSGPGRVVAALTALVAAEQTRRDALEAGVTPAAALLPGATALDPAVNLVLINNHRNGPRHEDYIYERGASFTLKRMDGKTGAKPLWFSPTYHGYVAFKLAPGQYQLWIDKEQRVIDVVTGGKPLYIAQTRSLLFNGNTVDELEAGKLLAMFNDGVNWAVPEVTPGSWQSKKRVLRWAPQ